MKKLLKNFGKMVGGKRRFRKKGTSLAVKISIFALLVKFVFKLLTALFFLFPYSVEKKENGWSAKAILYGVICTKKYNETTQKTDTTVNLHPLGIIGDQLKTAKNLVLHK